LSRKVNEMTDVDDTTHLAAVDAFMEAQAVCEYFNVENDIASDPLVGGPASAVACVVTAARAIAAVRAWVNQLNDEQVKEVTKRLAARQEWYALSMWKRLQD